MITLHQGDCLSYMRTMDAGSVDAVITDPPYNEVNRASSGLRNLDKGIADSTQVDIENVCENLYKIASGTIYVFCASEQVSPIRANFADNDMLTRVCVWEKTNPSPMNGQYVWLSGIELCVFARKKNAVFNEFCRNSVWRFKTHSVTSHPTEKPIELIKYIMQVSSNPGDTIFDPFMGSGTTGVAAVQLGRNFIGCELDAGYFAIAQKRIHEATLQPQLFQVERAPAEKQGGLL